MERISSVNYRVPDERDVPWTTKRLSNKLTEFSSWLLDRGRQLKALPRDPDLIRALLTADTLPDETASFRLGEVLNTYSLDGEHREHKVCGVRCGEFTNLYTVIDLGEMHPYILRENKAAPEAGGHAFDKHSSEAAISLRLGSHPHVVSTHAVYDLDGRQLLLTEYVPGETLDIHLNRRNLELYDVLKYSIHLCRALHHANTVFPGNFHNDVKSGNCIITTGRTLKLGRLGEAPFNASETQNKTGLDIYAFGITILEMLGVNPSRNFRKGQIDLYRDSLEQLYAARNVPPRFIDLIAGYMDGSRHDCPSAWTSLESDLQEITNSLFGEYIPNEPTTPETERDVMRRAVSLALVGHVNGAVDCIDKFAGDIDSLHDLLAVKAMILTTAGHFDEAYSASTSALMLCSSSFVVLLGHARVLISRGDLETAAAYLERALRIRPYSRVARDLLGEVLDQLP